MLRTHTLGELNASLIGQTVTVTGWVARRRDHGGVAFVDLRDRSGFAQIVVRDEADFDPLRNEWVLKVTGVVERRPEGNENPNLPSGEIELIVDELTVLNRAAALPFQVDEHVEVGEETRLRHRYLDLRRPQPAKIMALRSEANRIARELLHSEGFLEVETPTLTRSTPEGARDFLVPARLAPGSWYALPQSPQLFKQLLQVGGIEKYYQLARCYRDEDFRADRQPEFTQLDIEASFVEQDDIITLGEKIVQALWAKVGVDVDLPIRRMTYDEAMTKYGSDKPDLRFGLELTDLTEYFKDTPFRVFQNEYVGAVVMPGGASQARRTLDAWQEWAKQRGAKGLAYVLIQEDGTLTGPVSKNITDEEKAGLAAATGANPGDCIFFAAGKPKESRALLGAARVEIGRRCGLFKDAGPEVPVHEADWSFVWVVDAPMFEPAAEAEASGDVAVGSGAWTAVHHAFTSPKPEFVDTFDTDPGSALAYAYDIVCNGNEIGGGSIRIHDQDVQKRVFEVMGLSQEDAEEKFGFLLEGFKFGAPPHGGIAFGWDRVVALLAGTDSIREVIAFPKTGGGYDPLTAAPAPITAQQRKEAGVDAKPEEKRAAAAEQKEAAKGEAKGEAKP
ncbi:aspartate--tRNA ligase [Micrococcus lylae]|uniref:aspartate--tRNA ligase n=1 Tax=Micrococcus lylae TaxID=1273 RepID=UPI000C7FAD2F|nr:aspartate--tRNA ligase [Micrococcus lylae]MCT2006480.1 aspartate--tRNA ligase [Micrococcus lylae]MCT2070979.1 aspartate--tRNA ligase [Micrococcus lylae]WIK82995.1 aspartate--tRNA ligase [Micrococcus lylae]